MIDFLLKYREVTALDLIAFFVWAAGILPILIGNGFGLVGVLLVASIAGGTYGLISAYLQNNFGTVNKKESYES